MPSSTKPWIVITGCSSGIGLACAKRFVTEGHPVIGTFRDMQRAREIENELGDNFLGVHLEITKEPSIAQAVKEIERLIKDYGGLLGGIVNNSGVAIGGPLKYIPMDELRYQFEVNVFGLISFTQKLLPLLERGPAERKRRVINMSSVSGKISNPFLGPYAGSKHALEALSDALRLELSIHNVEVILIEPGPIQTPIWDKSIAVQEQYLHTEYAPYLRAVNHLIGVLKKNAIGPEKVANKVYVSWKKKSPKRRYLVTRQALFTGLFIRFAPDGVKDWLNKRTLRKVPQP